MDAIEILGDLLGHKTQRPGAGPDVLRDIFGRGSRQSSSPPPKKPVEIRQEAERLEDLLNVANKRSSDRRNGTAESLPHAEKATRQNHPPAYPPNRPREAQVEKSHGSDDERAVILIRAMVNAVKSDGKLDEREQQKMFDQIGNPTRDNVDYLHNMLAEPLDVGEFVRTVPFGMEQQVYTMSLIAIDLDDRSEANYLNQLADGLRIPVEVRKQIQQRLGAPGNR